MSTFVGCLYHPVVPTQEGKEGQCEGEASETEGACVVVASRRTSVLVCIAVAPYVSGQNLLVYDLGLMLCTFGGKGVQGLALGELHEHQATFQLLVLVIY